LNKNKSLIEEYFDYQKKYEELYGKDVVVFIEVGSFFEVYGIVNENEKMGKVEEISNILNIQLTRKNKSIKEISIKNPLLCGIPTVAFKKHLKYLNSKTNWTIILVEQITPPPKPKREVTEVISPGTLIEDINTNDSNYILSLNIEKNNDIYFGGGSMIDVSTGESKTFNSISTKEDPNKTIDDMFRFIKTYNPKEIILYTSDNIDINFINTELDINSLLVHYKNSNNINKRVFKLSFQNQLIQNIFKFNLDLLSPIEHLDLEYKQNSLISFIILLEFIKEHNEILINKIKIPEIIEESEYMILNSNAIYQLNLLSQNTLDSNSNITCLFDIINKTSTSLGKRLLKSRLLMPILNSEELNNRYQNIEDIEYKKYETELQGVLDIERLHRKLSLNKLNPTEFYQLHKSYESVYKILFLLKNENNSLNNLFEYEMFNKFKLYIKEYKKIFNLSELVKYNINDINGPLFQKGYNKKIDKKIFELTYLENKLLKYKITFNELVKENIVKLESTEKEGFYLSVSKSKIKLIESLNSIKIDNVEYQISDFSKIKNNTKMKFKNDDFQNISNHFLRVTDEIKFLTKDVYLETLELFWKEYKDIFKYLEYTIANIDVIKSNKKVSIQNKYSKPKIINSDENSKIDIVSLRHPIVEKISNEEFITNDIDLNDENNGIMIYGVNAAGKSIFLKSVGISIIMAQAGMYVPAKEMRYIPFNNIFTRITGEDNLFKGLSSFAVEMRELKDILNRGSKNSLVLADEMTKGTETDSAHSILAASILRLSELGIKFIFTTHLHKLPELEVLSELKNIRNFHLSVEYNENLKKLIYNRKLQKGSGSSLYGLEVAKSMGLNNDFIQLANKIRKDIIGDKGIRKSRYNSNKYIDKCEICGKPATETHHLKPQKLSDENGFIEHVNKNISSNLIGVCEKCHNKIHKN